MRFNWISPLLIGWLLAAGSWPATAQAERLTVAAAADLRSALPALLEVYAQSHPQVDVRVSYGSSGKLATQIEQGAPFDVYFSADESYPLRLQAQGLTLAPPQRYALGRLAIRVAAHMDLPAGLAELLDARYAHVAMANPEHAPYGARARQALQGLGLWDALAPRIVYAENVAQALQWVDSGAADAGIVALALLPAGGERVVIDSALHDPLWQAAVVLRSTAQTANAQALVDLLRSAQGRQILAGFGFDLPPVAP